ncbi:unnamed protein product, partial [Rotaria sp. Silwood2]
MNNNFPQPSIYESSSNHYYSQPIYSGAYEQIPSVNNINMNPQQQPMYQAAPQQSSPMYQTPFQQSSPMYQTPFQQMPPSYAITIESSSYPVPIQQQLPPVNNNQNLSTKNPTGPGALPPNQNKWPRKPISLVCPRCGATVTTRVEAQITTITWVL